MTEDPKKVVSQGYDHIAERYLNEWALMWRLQERDCYTRLLLGKFPAGAQVLELGCGAGIPTTQRLAERFKVTGVDISARQVELARANVSEATFICRDMTSLRLPTASFDAVVAFYSITHLPRRQHLPLLRRIATWLRPGGLFVAAMGAGQNTGLVEEDWFGAPMYFSHFASSRNLAMIAAAGLEILSAKEETADEFGTPITFLWVVARPYPKPL